MSQSDLRGELGEAGSIEEATGRHALVFVDHDDLCFGPPECYRASHEVVLAQGGLAVALQLAGARLAHVDDGQPLLVDRADLGGFDHAPPPRRSAMAIGSAHSGHSPPGPTR